MQVYFLNPRLTLLMACMSFSLALFAQTPTASYISDSISPNQFKHSLSLANDFQDLKEIRFNHYQVVDQDSLEVFSGTYRFEDLDPSAFYTFSSESQQVYFGLGLFEAGLYCTKLTFIRNDESSTSIFVN